MDPSICYSDIIHNASAGAGKASFAERGDTKRQILTRIHSNVRLQIILAFTSRLIKGLYFLSQSCMYAIPLEPILTNIDHIEHFC